MPLVSIIIAAYRAERWIDEAVASARAQTHREIEIIVVDDASPDGTVARIQNHVTADPRVRLFRLPENRGQSAALNHGLSHAHGEYVKFFDADDVLSPEMVARQLAVLDGHPGKVAYGEWARFSLDSAEAVFTPHPGWSDGAPLDWILETWRDTEPMYQCALFLIPRTLLDRTGGWDTSLSLILDFEFFTRVILASAGVRFASGARLYYRSNLPGSISRLKSDAALGSAWRATRLATDYVLAIDKSPRTLRICADVFQSFVYSYYPSRPDLIQAALDEVQRLGGSDLIAPGGRGFRLVSRLFGWRAALRIRRRAIVRKTE
ncbi:MAG TPA: glycosyltransferase family 2 protein [Rariglobus sp.]|nr:glycosyltransferase family 2 protein [Rariglobus sp.]